ncbi:MAG: cob(I)yrinic acid a,c-diamide adenosyltransferase, partial [Thermoplasmata archaeon]|nr:cob(I)yrinic acid a,c-diamide adenosyltransferase [Thermoplasmata archaeon]
MKGKIIVFTGDGKGKTTAAIGTAIRAIGYGKKVVMIQFLKKGEYGEIRFKNKDFKIYQFGRREFVIEPMQEDYYLAEKAIKFAEEILIEEKPFLLILDEVNVALSMELIKEKDLLSLLKKRKGSHIILTGRNASKNIIKIADLVTEMKKIKHYYDTGIKAIEGLE